MGANLQCVDGVIEEIMRIHKSLPVRPDLDEVEAAKDLILNVETEEQSRIKAITIKQQKNNSQVPDELLFVLQEMQKNLVFFHSKEEKREALKLLDLEIVHSLFDEFLQRASQCVSTGFSPSSSSSSSVSQRFSNLDDSYALKGKGILSYSDGLGLGVRSPVPQIVDSSLKPAIISGQGGEKLSLIKLASLIEVSLKKGAKDIDLQNKLMDQIEWLPDSIGKLSGLITLDLSENRLTVLPTKIGGLSSLTRLDLHSNRIIQLPDTIGDLFSLVFLDLRGNQLTSVPPTLCKLSRLEEIDLSSNRMQSLPESIGNLVSLKKLNVETNDIDELPHTIGHCSSLVELRADYNRLKALPEAVGRVESLEILTIRYNNIKQLPTTMASMSKLKELDISFNELESVPESLCLATSLLKLNVGNNFADLRSLPRSIGNLEMLEELDISNNQICVLPDSFSILSRLRVLHAGQNPLEVPPRYIIEKGAQAVVQYMAESVANRDIKLQPVRQKKNWAQFCFFSKSNKRKVDRLECVEAI